MAKLKMQKSFSQKILTKRLVDELDAMLENTEYEHPDNLRHFIDQLAHVIRRLEQYRQELEYEAARDRA